MTEAERLQALPTEEEEQTMVIHLRDMHRANTAKYPGLWMLHHIPNGGKRSASEAARFKAAGVQPGVPDLFLPVPRGHYHGLWLEMKRREGGRVSEEQKVWINSLRAMGYAAEVAYGADEAWEYIRGYYELGEFHAKT